MTRIPKSGSDKGFIIESVNPKKISETDLRKITEIEQDMWAREDGIGEYIKCDSCGKIHSKEEVFGHLSSDIKTLTVGKIEGLLGVDEFSCLDCGGNATPIYDRNEYIEEIRDRYNNSVESFLTVYRDGQGEIRGFFDGYVDSLEALSSKEFYFLDNSQKDSLIRGIEIKIGKIPELLLAFSSLGMEEEYKSFYILYLIMKTFFNDINKDFGNNYIGIAEVIIGSNPHGIYHGVGAERLGMDLYHNSIKTDIFIHTNIIRDYIESMSGSVKSFLKNNGLKMRDVISV